VKAATGEVVTAEDLGGGDVHTRLSGVADHLAQNDAHALAHRARASSANLQPAQTRRRSTSPRRRRRTTTAEELYGVDPDRHRASPSTCARSSPASSTAREFDEFKARYGTTLVMRLRAHLTACRSASSPTTASCSANRRSRARTSSSCAASASIPLVFLQNITGFMVGREVRGRRHRHATAPRWSRPWPRAQVPKFTVIIGGSFGAGNYGMCGRAYRPALPVDVAQRAHLA